MFFRPTSFSVEIHQFVFFSLLIKLGPPSGKYLMIYHHSLPLSPPSSRMSLNNTSSVLSKTSRMHWCGGTRTEQSTPGSLGWRWIICRYQVYAPSVSHLQVDLTNPIATSVDVERVFSKGRLVLSHIRNGLSVQSMRALMCLNAWSTMGLVKDKDVMEAARLPDVNGNEAELDLDSNWD